MLNVKSIGDFLKKNIGVFLSYVVTFFIAYLNLIVLENWIDFSKNYENLSNLIEKMLSMF